MPDTIYLLVNLVRVGPRSDDHTQLPVALQMALAYEIEASNQAGFDAQIARVLPWDFAPGAQLTAAQYVEPSKAQTSATVHFATANTGDFRTAFTKTFINPAKIENTDLTWDTKPPADPTKAERNLPRLVMQLAQLPAPVNQDLRACAYGVLALDPGDKELHLAPEIVLDRTVYIPKGTPSLWNGGCYQWEYEPKLAGHPTPLSVKAIYRPVKLDEAAVSGPFDFKTYWMPSEVVGRSALEGLEQRALPLFDLPALALQLTAGEKPSIRREAVGEAIRRAFNPEKIADPRKLEELFAGAGGYAAALQDVQQWKPTGDAVVDLLLQDSGVQDLDRLVAALQPRTHAGVPLADRVMRTFWLRALQAPRRAVLENDAADERWTRFAMEGGTPFWLILRQNWVRDAVASVAGKLSGDVRKAVLDGLTESLVTLVQTLPHMPGELAKQLREAVAAVFPEEAQAVDPRRADAVPRGICLRLGAPKEIAGKEDYADNDPLRAIAGFGLMVRRGQRNSAGPWHLATAGRIAHRDQPMAANPVVTPLQIGYQNGLSRPEVTYFGRLLGARDALRGTAPDVAVRAGNQQQGLEALYEIVPHPDFQVPALRFGDTYSFAAFMVDNAGGLPTELSAADKPWLLAGQPPEGGWSVPAGAKLSEAVYRRSNPVGDVSLEPAKDHWPAIAEGVRPAAREAWDIIYPQQEKSDEAPSKLPHLLLNARDLPKLSLTVVPPATDPDTLMQWAAPPLNAPEAERDQRTAAIKTALKKFWVARHEATSGSASDVRSRAGLILDPAIIGVQLRLLKWNGAGFDEVASLLLPINPLGLGYQVDRAVTTLDIRFDPTGNAGIAPGDRPEILLPEAFIGYVDIHAVIAPMEADRFALGVLTGLDPNGALEGSTVLLETPSTVLPDAKELWDALGVAAMEGGRSVRATLALSDKFQAVDRVELIRERWAWRGRPLTLDRSKPDIPGELKSPKRDKDPKVRDWEAVVTMDNAMVERPRHHVTLPLRALKTGPGEKAPVITLLDDSLDYYQGADYLRYGLVVRSRYAPLLSSAEQLRDTRETGRWRRLLMPCRTGKPTPPMIYGVVPLTKGLEPAPQPREGLAFPAPVLVVMTHQPFREYGIGERIVAHAQLEDAYQKTVGDDPPYAVGPAGDLYGGVGYWGRESDKKDIDFPLVGPFGHTFERSSDEVGIRACSYVLQPLEGMGPSWLARVAFRRQVYGESGDDGVSDWTLPRWIEFQPRSDFSMSAKDQARPDVTMQTAPDRNWSLKIRKAGFYNLHPTGTPPDVAGADCSHLYFILVMRLVRDVTNAGEGEALFALCRIEGVRDTAAAPDIMTAKPLFGSPKAPGDKAKLCGRVLEVRLNGRYPVNKSPLESPDLSFAGFWQGLFPKEDAAVYREDFADAQDAEGMIRRMSPPFAINR